jgi:poly(3-hydroxybutyrate) depolymerase
MESEPAAPVTRTIETVVHGRYLLRVPPTAGPWPALFSFHGYAEDAAVNMTALERIPDISGWLLVAVQALHPFYTKNDRIVASWMTRQDRELAIADNVRYASSVVAAVLEEFHVTGPIAFAGFSQGGAMAYRAAAAAGGAGVIILAADVPPDVTSGLPPVLIGRGDRDAWYSEDKLAADLGRLRGMAVEVETCVFEGDHEWTDAFGAAAGRFLNRVARRA